MSETVTIKLAGVPLNFPKALLNEYDSRPFLAEYDSSAPLIRPDDETGKKLFKFYTDKFTDSEKELSICISRSSDTMLRSNACIFHALAFQWRGKVWFFTGQSGAGKSTQYFEWKRLLGDEIKLINGDKPAIKLENGSITVSPSPWRGKERIGNPISGTLGGIIYLKQDYQNSIVKMTPAMAAAPIFKQFIFSAANEETVSQVCAIEDAMLKDVPVFLFCNTGNAEAAGYAARVIKDMTEVQG